MSRLYQPQHRALQDRFDSRPMADRIELIAAKTEIDDMARAFIESRDMFFLSSVDHQGRPTVSYKGGDPGFVRVLDAKTLAFPSYDGNGMYFSMGNIAANPEIGCLFIDFEKPFRLRLQGRAELVKQVRAKINELGIQYIYYQFISVTGRIVGKGIPADHWEAGLRRWRTGPGGRTGA